jgi:glycosyltransferase involved in cell wall biosynthesis
MQTNRRTKVLHITAAIAKAGAGAGAVLTHEALLRRGVDSRILFLKDPTADGTRSFSFAHLSRGNQIRQLMLSSLDRAPLVTYRHREARLFSPGLVGLALEQVELFRWADVVHLHWINHGFINVQDLGRWRKPVVWTMRDMWAFTGGCHYSLDCDRYTRECGRCPLLGSKSEKDLSRRVFAHKQACLPSAPIHWVAISRWLRDSALRSSLLQGKEIRVIASGINTADFAEVDPHSVRASLGIPEKGKVVLLGALDLREKYKGFAVALDALRATPGPLTVVTFGQTGISAGELPHRVVNLGYVNGPAALSRIYSAADVFLAPSLGEAFGKTFAEAQSCGLPVVCFDETGPADIVEHLKSGYLAKYQDRADLLSGLTYCLGHRFDHEYISSRARRFFDINAVAKQYVELYSEVCHANY